MAIQPRRDEILAEVTGQGAAAAPFHGFQPASWSSSRLILTRDYVIEDTKFFVSARHTTLRLQEVESVSMLTSGNPLLLALGFATLVVFGLGLVFLILYFFFKYRFLVIHGKGNSVFLCVKGKIDKYEEFAEELLDTIKRNKGSEGSSSGGSSSGGLSGRAFGGSTSGSTSEKVAAASEGKRTISVQCPECDSEYQVPSTSVGKRFRCQKCQAVVDVQG